MNYNRISRPRHVLARHARAREWASATARDFKRDSDIRIEFWFRWDFYGTKQNAVELKKAKQKKMTTASDRNTTWIKWVWYKTMFLLAWTPTAARNFWLFSLAFARCVPHTSLSRSHSRFGARNSVEWRWNICAVHRCALRHLWCRRTCSTECTNTRPRAHHSDVRSLSSRFAFVTSKCDNELSEGKKSRKNRKTKDDHPFKSVSFNTF